VAEVSLGEGMKYVEIVATVTVWEAERLRVLADMMKVPFAKMAGAAVRGGLDGTRLEATVGLHRGEGERGD
jgi:hypothetical protein